MNRRSFFKAVTGFVAGIFVSKVEGSKRSGTRPASAKGDWIDVRDFGATIPKSMTAEEWVEAQFNPVKELQFGQPFTGKIVSMTKFQGNLWIATKEGVYRIRDKLV